MDLLEEFDKLIWRNPNILYQHAPEVPFLTEEEISRSLIFPHIEESVLKEREQHNVPSKETSDPQATTSTNIPPKQRNQKKKNPKSRAVKDKTEKYSTAAEIKPKPIVESCLTKVEQAECLHALQLFQTSLDPKKLTPAEKQCLATFNEFRSDILAENARFQTFVQTKWTTELQNKCSNLSAAVLEAFKMDWNKKLENVTNFPGHYTNSTSLPLTFEDAEHVQMSFVENVVNKEEFIQLRGIPFANGQALNVFEKGAFQKNDSNDKHADITKDRLANDISQQCNVDVVISSSGLKRLLNNHGPDYSNQWEIPIVIRKVQKSDSSESKSVIYFHKPLPPKQPNDFKIRHNVFKRVLRKIIKQEYWKHGVNKSMGDNVSYNIWKMHYADERNVLMKTKAKMEEFRILIRSKIDGAEALNNDASTIVTVSPKLENQITFGATVSTLNDLTNQWTSLFFRPNSILYRVRIDSLTSTVKMCERCNLEKIVAECLKLYNFKPQSKLGVLYNLISELKKLKPGNYVLQHTKQQGAFVSVFKETIPQLGVPNIYDLHASYRKENCSVKEKERIPWSPIDVNVILPKNLKEKTMPGMFTPVLRIRRRPNKGKQTIKSSKTARKKSKRKKKKTDVAKT